MDLRSAQLFQHLAGSLNFSKTSEQMYVSPPTLTRVIQRLEQELKYLTLYRREQILPGVEICFREAGHILGSTVVELWGDGRKLVFSGDIGPKGSPILRDPAVITEADLVLMESTYGDRNHRERLATVEEIGELFERAWQDRGNVLIPAFAVGRSQELLYWFAKYWDQWGLSRWKIFLDSPMAAKVVEVYGRHESLFDDEAKRVWRSKPHPFRMPNLRITQSPDESMAINRLDGGAIIIAGSGMANGGRIVHHLKFNLGRRHAHVLFVGFQAEGTLGRRLVRAHGRQAIGRTRRRDEHGVELAPDQFGLGEAFTEAGVDACGGLFEQGQHLIEHLVFPWGLAGFLAGDLIVILDFGQPDGIHTAGKDVVALPVPEVGRLGLHLIAADQGVQAAGVFAGRVRQQPGGGDRGIQHEGGHAVLRPVRRRLSTVDEPAG